jgi:hypothetical protein
MKKDLRLKKLVLKTDTLGLLEDRQLPAVQGGGTTTVAATVFSEGACETYSWWYRC